MLHSLTLSEIKLLVGEVKQGQGRQAVAPCSFSTDDFDLPGCSDIFLQYFILLRDEVLRDGSTSELAAALAAFLAPNPCGPVCTAA